MTEGHDRRSAPPDHLARRPEDPRALGDRVDALLQQLATSPNPAHARAKAEELVSTLVRLYGAGLTRILEIVDENAGDSGGRIFRHLCDDDLVASLLILHGLHPLSLEERIVQALDRVRVYLKSHEGDVQLLRIEGETVYLRMAGSCHGCPSSASTMKLAIERAIHDAAPEITEIRAEGVHDGAVTRKPTEWVSLAALPDLSDNGMASCEVEGMPVLFLRSPDALYAYRNQCPRCLVGLSRASLRWPLLACVSCGQEYDVVKAGRAPDQPELHIEPFPLVVSGDKVQLAIPVVA